MSNIGAPQQHRQSSRKGKRAWRKNVDVTQVEDGLEDLRNEIRYGGPISEKKSEELFALDTVGSEEIKKKHNLQKPLKVDKILAQRSAVPALDSRKRSLPTGIYDDPRKKQKGEWVSKKEIQRLKNAINTTSHLQTAASNKDESSGFDLWLDQPNNGHEDNLEYVPKPQPKVAPNTIRRAPVSMTASGKPVRAVRNPSGGTSYNPSFDEWEELLRKEGEKEVSAETARLQAVQMEEEKQARIAAAAAEEGKARQSDNESAWEGFETENEDEDMLSKKRPKRKTPAERNKAKRKKEAERLAKHEKKMGDKKKQEAQIRELKASSALSKAEKTPEITTVNEGDEESGDDSKLRRKKMGNVTIPDKNLELVLPDELQESLRLLRPEGNLLQDRFRNLLVNGKIESRKAVPPKKKRVKYTEKWSSKDFEIEV